MTPPTPVPGSLLLGLNAIVMGPSGSGKTTSLKTLLNVPELEGIFYLATEPRYDVLGAEFLSHPKVHWRYLRPATSPWSTYITIGKTVNVSKNDTLQTMKGIQQEKTQQWLELLEQMHDFRDQHGKSWGDVTEWGTNRVLALDGLTGIDRMSRQIHAGAKPILSQPDWGVIQQLTWGLIEKLSVDTRCHFILLAHVEREKNEVTGRENIMVSSHGRKLAPKLPINFSDTILSVKEGANFYWDTHEPDAEVKGGHLPIRAKMPPDFKPLFQGWAAKGGRFEP